MWIRKSDEAIKQEAYRKEINARKYGMYTVFIICIIDILFSKFIGTKSQMGSNTLLGPTMSWDEIRKSLPSTLMLGIFIGFVFYQYDRKFRHVSSLLCDSCGKIIRYSKQHNECPCGGHFVLLDQMKWIDTEEDEKAICSSLRRKANDKAERKNDYSI